MAFVFVVGFRNKHDSFMFVGVAKDPFSQYTKHLGQRGTDKQGWGYFGNRGSKWHDGETSHGKGYKTGDAVSCVVDLGQGTLEFLLNGQSQGVAFSNVEGPVRPAVSIHPKDNRLNIAKTRANIACYFALFRLRSCTHWYM